MPLSKSAVPRRKQWIDEIVKISGRFGQDAARIVAELQSELERDGSVALIDHLHLCGAIPEQYGHDSSEEKLYSKYTDALLSTTFRHLGFESDVLVDRGDAADVEASNSMYGFVADAKAFRLSRTAKNQKDFKVEAMHGWKRGRAHAMVVCPIYQLPLRASQIYQQAIARQVCLFSYSHLSVLIGVMEELGEEAAQDLLLQVFLCTEGLEATKTASGYWAAVNKTMLGFHKCVAPIWRIEKGITEDAISASRKEALAAIEAERASLASMSHKDAIAALMKLRNVDGRESVIARVCDNDLLAT